MKVTRINQTQYTITEQDLKVLIAKALGKDPKEIIEFKSLNSDWENCTACDGEGARDIGDDWAQCPDCSGEGGRRLTGFQVAIGQKTTSEVDWSITAAASQTVDVNPTFSKAAKPKPTRKQPSISPTGNEGLEID